MNVEITKITIIRTGGTDKIALETNMSNGLFPYTGNATLYLDVAKGTAEEYIYNNFGDIEFELINAEVHYK